MTLYGNPKVITKLSSGILVMVSLVSLIIAIVGFSKVDEIWFKVGVVIAGVLLLYTCCLLVSFIIGSTIKIGKRIIFPIILSAVSALIFVYFDPSLALIILIYFCVSYFLAFLTRKANQLNVKKLDGFERYEASID